MFFGPVVTYLTGSGSGSGNGSESSLKSAKSEKSESVGLENVALNRVGMSVSSLFMVCGPADFIVTAAISLVQRYCQFWRSHRVISTSLDDKLLFNKCVS